MLTYILDDGLVDLGMRWWKAMLTVALGTVLVLVPTVVTDHPGIDYGIPFPMPAAGA